MRRGEAGQGCALRVSVTGVDPLTLDVLRRVLERRGLEVVGQAADVAVHGVTYDDVADPPSPSGRWVALLATPSAALRQAAAAAGAADAVTRQAGLDVLERSLVRVGSGQRDTGEKGASLQSDDRVASLTRREVLVLRLITRGMSNSEIAGELGISPNTARTHVQNVLGKLGVHTRLAAAALGRSAGLG